MSCVCCLYGLPTLEVLILSSDLQAVMNVSRAVSRGKENSGRMVSDDGLWSAPGTGIRCRMVAAVAEWSLWRGAYNKKQKPIHTGG